MQGVGTVWNPFVIENITDFQNIELDKTAHYILNSDIDGSATSGWAGGFVPIAGAVAPYDFSGSLDGRGHKVTNLYINPGIAEGCFVFYSVTGTIQNIGFEDVEISTAIVVSGVCAINSGFIRSTWITGIVDNGYYVSGFCDTNSGEISNCYARTRKTTA